MLRESVLLAASGAVFGVLLARRGTKALAAYLDVFLELAPDYRVLGFTIAITAVTGLLFGIVPAWRGSRIDPFEAMKPGERGSTGARSLFGKSLVAAQVAICMLLVTGCAALGVDVGSVFTDKRRAQSAPDLAAIVAASDLTRAHRFEMMMAEGALDEVVRLRERKLDPLLPIMRAHGVPGLMAHLDGAISLEEAIRRGQADTRAYAKRQVTWFRHQMTGWQSVAPEAALEAALRELEG